MERLAKGSRPARADWRRLHADAMVWLLHDHFFHRLDANLAMRRGGVTAKVAVPVADVGIYNDSGEDHRAFYERTLAQVDGWAVESLVRLERTRRLYESRPDRFLIATSAADVRRAKRQDKAAIFFGLEGCKCFEGRIELLETFYRLGVRQMQLTWSNPNQLIGLDSSGGWKLSGFGREAVAAMNELGIVIDLSHAPWSLFEDVIDRSRDPVIVSHGAPLQAPGGCGDMGRPHLEALKARGGLLGLHFCSHYINGPFATFEDFLATIDFMVENGYEDITALGGDLFEDDAYFRARHPAPGGATHESWRVFIPELNDVARLPDLTRALLARGYSQSTIRKILGRNAIRAYRRILRG